MKITWLAAVVLFASLSLAGGCASPDTRARRAQLEFDKGLAYETGGETGEAEDCYEDALEHDKDHLASLQHLGRIKTMEDEPDDAIPLLKRAVELTDGSPDAYNDLAYAYDTCGYADPAEAAYLRGIQADPAHARLRTNYGLMLARHGRTNEALLQLRAVMSPADAYYNLAVVLENQGRRARAKREFQRALDADPDHVDAELHMAAINFEE